MAPHPANHREGTEPTGMRGRITLAGGRTRLHGTGGGTTIEATLPRAAADHEGDGRE